MCRGAHLTCLVRYSCACWHVSVRFMTGVGYEACLAVMVACIRWFLLMLDHVSYTLQKLWLSFQIPHQIIIQSETARQCYKYLLY